MTFGQAMKETSRGAVLFAVFYFLATALFDLWLVGAIDWREQAVSAVIVTGVYWVISAWMRKRRAA